MGDKEIACYLASKTGIIQRQLRKQKQPKEKPSGHQNGHQNEV